MISSSFLPDIEIPLISVGKFVMSSLDNFNERIALIEMQTDRKITFKKLKNKVLQLTEILWKAGLRKGDIVGLVLPFNIDTAPLLVAIINCGAAIFGCKLMYRWSVLKQLNDIRPRLVIVSDDRYDEVSTQVTDKISEIELCVSLTQLNSLKPNSIRYVENLPCYDNIDVRNDLAVIYQSSGTTGNPKGILLTHYNLMATILIGQVAKQLLPGSILAGAVSLISSVGCNFFFQSLITGVTLAFAPDITSELFFKYVTKYKINTVGLSDLSCLLDIANLEMPKETNISSLKYLFVGGCIFSKEILQNVSKKLKDVLVASEYGMSECFWVTMPSYTSTTPLNSVGYLCPNMKLKVINIEDGRECGPNERGELYVNGPCLMKGYYSRDRSDIFGLIEGWLPTGDLGYYDQNECIYVFGRIKDVIKIPPSGTAVLPIEFEEILLKHNLIKDVAVLAVPHSLHDEVAKAFIVRSDDRLTKSEVLQFFSIQVDFILSLDGGVEFVDFIPRTEIGKPLRRELLKHHLSNDDS